MENASKFLIMAATVLLAMMLMGVFVYVFRAGASVDEQYDLEQAENQLELYNSRFENYNVQDNTIMDLITVANLAYDINTMTNYDNSNSVQIEIVIGSKIFTVPAPQDENEKNRLRQEFKKNQILNGSGDIISIYDLANKTVKDLKASGGGFDINDKLSKTHLGNITYTDINGNYTSKLATIYKYIWNCTQITYHDLTGRVASMRFERFVPESDSDLYWNPDFDEE